MHGYSSYTEDVVGAFGKLFETHGMQIVEADDSNVYAKSSKCGISLGVEFEDLIISFINPVTEQGFIPSYILECVHRGTAELDWPTFEDETDKASPTIKALLQLYPSFIEEHFKFILDGDFSWEKQYLSFLEKKRFLNREVYELPDDHPIKQKFWDNDQNWLPEMAVHMRKSKDWLYS